MLLLFTAIFLSFFQDLYPLLVSANSIPVQAMVEVTHNFEITYSIFKDKLVEALLKAKGFFPHVLSPGVMCADIQEKTSIEGRLQRTVRDTVKANQEPFLYNHSTVERDELGNISKEISHEVFQHRRSGHHRGGDYQGHEREGVRDVRGHPGLFGPEVRFES
ncbi:uncharacterized protein LOC104436811 isoform X2 [Eucalyptus grandis]|uniref:uncharacterized protein LOC104436811 isoform X2 n=1 Tax=Eucalyptus grandis TaxID=71139 RepID=UPI00192EFCA2|nr:uncharacterized protein LOC104436811 isoform X2 [Eucalyptus grandis]